MQLFIASAVAFIAGVAIAAAWPTARQRIAYWTGYAAGRIRKLSAQRWAGVDLDAPTVTSAEPDYPPHIWSDGGAR